MGFFQYFIRFGFSILFGAFLMVLQPSFSTASAINYTYSGGVDTNCLVENIGSATCSVQGSFTLDSNLFGTEQETLGGNMTLSINGADVFTLNLFGDPYKGQIGECTEVCNSVLTTPGGDVTGFNFFAVPTWTFGDIVSFTHLGWSWDGFINGQTGIYSGASGATISRSLSVVPIPATLPLFISGLIGLGYLATKQKL